MVCNFGFLLKYKDKYYFIETDRERRSKKLYKKILEKLGLEPNNDNINYVKIHTMPAYFNIDNTEDTDKIQVNIRESETNRSQLSIDNNKLTVVAV